MGRAIWALGATVGMAPDHGTRQLAREMLKLAFTQPLEFGPRGQALVIMGLEALLKAEPDNASVRAAIRARAEYLCQRFAGEADDRWKWFEPTLTYDNAFLPQALFLAFGVTGEPRTLRVAIESLDFLERVCFAPSVGAIDATGKHLALVGNQGWHERGSEKPLADEQPIDAAAFVLAFRSAYLVTGERRYLGQMRLSFDWFLGANRLNAHLYDYSTGGCRDGLGTHEASQNQGAESTVSFLLSLLTLLDVGEPQVRQRIDAPPRAFARTRDDRPEVVTLTTANDWPVGNRSGHSTHKRPREFSE